MNKLNLSSRGQYRNKRGTIVFRYAVKGTDKAMQAFEDAQGEYHVVDQDSGETLYFTPRFAGKNATLIVTDEGKVYVDMSELEQQASLIAQFGGNLGQAMADTFARKLAGGGSASSKPTADKADEQDEDNGGLPEPQEEKPASKPASRRVRR
jgi:hypothetical protein